MNKIQVSEKGKAKIKEKYGKQQAGYTVETLAKAANASPDQIKYLIGNDTQKVKAVDRFVIENVVNAINAGLKKNGIDEKLQASDIVDNWYPVTIPTDFQTVIDDKTKLFCGRKFVFNAINQFIKDHKNGYFTILGDAGMGKSAIAAKYIVDHPGTICFFNIRAEGRNRPDVFLKLIRQQLVNINRFDLQNAENDDLSTLLTKASEKLSNSENLIIVIDGLDEVDQEDNGNLLNLPMYLPEKVYLILTRRPYNSEDKRLTLSPNTKYTELDLRDYQDNSKEDVEEYIWEFLSLGKYKAGLENWINQQNDLSKPKFVDTIAAKSENNFMYLRYVLEAIAEGFYQDEKLEELPKGLEGYYETHWRIMGMTTRPLPKDKIKIIYVMCALKSPVSREMIVKYSQEDNLTVQEVLKGWTQFLQEQKTYQPPRYRFYHESFRDFLQRQDIVEAAGVSLPEISAEVAKNMGEGLIL
ncbi:MULTISPECIES: ATP-binding protein [unclassified Dolichospermum]|uniref:ATP-binding protein n=1 Tax=unclassified Dolichospermum TaxID=2622029 RepID=UPI00144737AB|nr:MULTISPECIES: ATP-binding protein [unclassified Dolichospermum]MTJ15634.1 ATP-binding protein [Dolichospermum sp. UHCC 0299]MTJ41563.1 ATP-binding protein [Dolichospermum sp. UHCC 0406]